MSSGFVSNDGVIAFVRLCSCDTSGSASGSCHRLIGLVTQLEWREVRAGTGQWGDAGWRQRLLADQPSSQAALWSSADRLTA